MRLIEDGVIPSILKACDIVLGLNLLNFSRISLERLTI